MLFFNCSVVFAGFSSEALASRINDGKLKICVLFFKPSISQLVGKNIALLNFVKGALLFFLITIWSISFTWDMCSLLIFTLNTC